MNSLADAVFVDGRITTQDRQRPEVEALAVAQGAIVTVGPTAEILQRADPLHAGSTCEGGA